MASLMADQQSVALAERWLGTVRRVDRVDIDYEHNTARVTGIRSRLPFEQSVPVALAQGLAALGCPTIIRGRQRP